MHEGSVAVEVQGLFRSYGDGASRIDALRGAAFQVAEGEVVALVGPSGSGKTTLLNCILGMDRPDRGDIRVFDVEVTSLSYEGAVAWRRRDVAIAFQAAGLLPHLSARENVDIALRVRGVSRTEREARVETTLERLGVAHVATHRPAELSGGQQQRVALARGLAAQPRLLVADEPTGELDSETTATTLDVLHNAARAEGITMLVATHDAAVEAMADRTLRMNDGTIA